MFHKLNLDLHELILSKLIIKKWNIFLITNKEIYRNLSKQKFIINL